MSAYLVFIRYIAKGILFYGGSNDKKIYCAVMPIMTIMSTFFLQMIYLAIRCCLSLLPG